MYYNDYDGSIMSISVSIRIPEHLAKKLNAVAKDTERTRSFVIQKALEVYLEEYADLQVALDRLRDTADPIISSDEIRKSLGV